MNVAIFAVLPKSVKLHNPALIKSIQALGNEVFLMGLDSCDNIHPDYEKHNVTFLSTPISRTNTNPIKEILTIKQIRRVLRDKDIHCLIIYGIKTYPVMVTAAKLAGVKKIICIVNGTGRLFRLRGAGGFFVRLISFPMLWLSFALADNIFFQNLDDLQLIKKKIHFWRKDYSLVNGSGVNLDFYLPAPLPENPIFLMVCRLTGDKGVNEYVEAAIRVKEKYPAARFYLVGPHDDNDRTINLEVFNKAVTEGIVTYTGAVEDVRPYIKESRVFVFPSYYEGTPRAVLEAMAMGRPIITTNATGCKETVEESVNGFKVPVKSTEALVQKMIWMIEHPAETAHMGIRSRNICEQKYDVRTTNRKIIETLAGRAEPETA